MSLNRFEEISRRRFLRDSRADGGSAKVTIVPLRRNLSVLSGVGGNIIVLPERKAQAWRRLVSNDNLDFGKRPGTSPMVRGGYSVWVATLVLLVVNLLGGCRTQKSPAGPTIEFTKIPPAAQGGRERTDVISGRVEGAGPNQRIVVYARAGPWWVQPWPDKPFIPIQADHTWSTPTHLGFEYAALLVDPGYDPPPTIDVAPTAGGSVVMVQTVKGVGAIQLAPTKLLRFSGYDWNVRTIAGDRGGLNNLYDADNAWTDASGALHLRIKKRAGRWACAEVELSRSLGYGTYIITVRDTSRLEPAAVLSLNTFDDWGGDQHFRELDVETSRWGDANNKNNAQFGIQPFYIPGNLAPFTQPAGTLTHSFRWVDGSASFKTVRGSSIRAGGPVVSEHVFTSGVPTAGEEKFQFLFYVVGSDKNPLQHENEVAVEKFQYLP
jgi:hypothetical protein